MTKKITIKKKIIKWVIIVIPILLLLSGMVYDVNRLWGEENTWDKGKVFSVSETPNIYIFEEDDNVITYEIPYCTLTSVLVLKDGRVKYECSFLPYYMINVAKTNHKEFANLAPDITFYRNPEKDPLPSEFLGYSSVTEESLQSYGELNIPVSLLVSVRIAKKDKTVWNALAHYMKVRTGKKEIENQNLVSWEMKKLSESLSQEDMKKWADEMSGYIALYIEMDSYDGIETEPLRNLTGYELMNRLSDEFSYQNYHCSFDDLICTREYDENPASNIMLYLYFLNNRDDEFVQTFLDTAREKVFPFASREKLKEKKTVCTEEPCEELDYGDMQTYTFPVCPIREVIIEKDYHSKNVALFLEQQRYYSEFTRGGLRYKKEDLISRMETLLQQTSTYAESRDSKIEADVPDSFDVEEIDNLCYHLVKYEIKDPKIMALFEKAYIGVISEAYGQINDSGEIESFKNLETLKDLPARSYMHLTDEPFISHERLTYWQMISEFEDRGDFAKNKKYTASIPLTLLLMYLYD